MEALWQTNRQVADAARWSRQRTVRSELAILVTLGVVAAVATSVATGPWRLPGHAILRGALPVILGISLVPRRSAGTVMAAAAAVAFAVMRMGGLGPPNAASWVGVLCLGPAADVALASATGGWMLYARCAAAGLVANLAAFAARMALGPVAVLQSSGGRGMGRGNGSAIDNGLGGGRGGLVIDEFWIPALISFAAFGALAGLLCAALWFRARPREPGTPSP